MILASNNLSFKYTDKPVLDDINLEVSPGEMLGVLGPNGCGKSTFLRLLNKNLEPIGGNVVLLESDLSTLTKKEIARHIAVVPQGNEIRFSFTVREIVSMGRMPFQGAFGWESREDLEIIDNALRLTGLYDMADREVNTMSGGERQRVIIARALAQCPEVILLDEPTLHLDISMQFEMLDFIEHLIRSEKLAAVIVSHDLPMVARYCDRVAMIHNHKVLCCGTPEETLTPENMDSVFGVDAELSVDAKTGRRTVLLHGASRHI